MSADSHRRTIGSWATLNPVGPSVDVFLPTCGEDMIVLANTYRYVEQLRWSGDLHIWVLDDAERPEVELEARAHGFNYLVRPNRGFMKKAGNLQFGYEYTNADLIVVLDADFCPRPDFLDHLVPYLDDPDVGIVQSPQYFGTTTSMNWLERTSGATQELFYRWVQPSRDAAGAPICVGTSAVYRRAALQVTGGFAQIEHSEDVHTGIFLLRAGFATRYVPILVSKGLCPSDLASFLNQQYRWCNGSITLLLSGNAQRHPLTIRQRICFWAGFIYYISTAINVFAVHIPGIVMAVFFPLEVRAAHFAPFLAGAWIYFVLLPRMSKSRWRFEVMRTQMAYSFSHAVAIFHKLTGRTQDWVATGTVGRGSSLAHAISVVGATTIGISLTAAWTALVYDFTRYGPSHFWLMAVFLGGYTYLAAPLLVEFLRVLDVLPVHRESVTIADKERAVESPNSRISTYKAVGYTSVLVFLAAIALGYFDLMVLAELT
ncbi:glycosyltransferase family 2 protein [Rhodococcus sp. BH5]|uniref:glycosyltransferase family 2 protein n=1 Tax=Rhodococcus sp. BH5 TaxID=2871702 RepID=UPI0022CD8927|nr:cellulose synthase catalytic subunit [Rhodococcus sp. BH5]MCZ9635135.1 cellulose synthase catalytic subunit [Rhodococcus sp. BH5]